MAAQLSLTGTAVRRPVGRRERALATTLRAWRPHLSGPEHAADRALLHAAFAAVDSVETAHDSGDATAYSVAMVVRSAAELLRGAAPVFADVDVDPLEEHLER